MPTLEEHNDWQPCPRCGYARNTRHGYAHECLEEYRAEDYRQMIRQEQIREQRDFWNS